MRTLEDWLKILPPEIRRDAEAIIVERFRHRRCASLHEAITRLDWWRGRMTHAYWRKLRNDIRDGKLTFGATEEYQIF